MVNIGVYLPKSTAGADMVMVICLPLIIVSNTMDFVGMDPPVIGLVYVYDDSILLAGCPKRWKVSERYIMWSEDIRPKVLSSTKNKCSSK
jgi:hypothetical protein